MPLRRWKAEDALEALKAAAIEIGEPLRIKDYAAWAATNDQPSTTVVRRYLGPWRDALAGAGLSYTGFTDDDVINAVRHAAGEIGAPFTANAYISWRRSNRWAPSWSTVASRLHGLDGVNALLSDD